MRVLVLTDHRTHRESNSFYGICNELNNHPQIDELVVASRGTEKNSSFFLGKSMIEVFGLLLKAEIRYPSIKLFNSKMHSYSLKHFNFILLRIPHPISSTFLSELSRCFPEDRIVNRPSGIQLTSDKKFLLNFADYTAPISICDSLTEIENIKKLFSVVLKPRWGYGGEGIVRLEKNIAIFSNRTISYEEFTQMFQKKPQSYLVMKYLKNVSAGDKRILVAEGQILKASIRYPKPGGWLCNISQGGSALPAQITDQEREIINAINPTMQQNGIFLYGLDTLEEDDGQRVISEINTLSPGGFVSDDPEIEHRAFTTFTEQLVQYFNERL